MSESAARPAPLSTAAAARRVFELSFGEMLWSRRTIFMALVVGGPVLLAIIFRVVEAFGAPALRVNGARVAGGSVFGVMIWMLYIRFIVPVLGLFYGTALMADEVEDKTLTYLFTRPIPRGSVLLGKYLAYLACTSLVVLPSVMLTYFLTVPFAQIAATFRSLVLDLALLGAGLAVYGAVFAFVGARLKRPLVSGLVFAFGWEQLALALPGSPPAVARAAHDAGRQHPERHPGPVPADHVGVRGPDRPRTDAGRVPVAGHAHRGPSGVRARAVAAARRRRPWEGRAGWDERLNLPGSPPV
jgi:hypothetical protein